MSWKFINLIKLKSPYNHFSFHMLNTSVVDNIDSDFDGAWWLHSSLNHDTDNRVVFLLIAWRILCSLRSLLRRSDDLMHDHRTQGKTRYFHLKACSALAYLILSWSVEDRVMNPSSKMKNWGNFLRFFLLFILFVTKSRRRTKTRPCFSVI